MKIKRETIQIKFSKKLVSLAVFTIIFVTSSVSSINATEIPGISSFKFDARNNNTESSNFVYVKNGKENAQTGQGTKDVPYDSLKYAIKMAKNGDTIRLVEDVLFRPMDNDKAFRVDKDITIDGQNYRLTFRGLDFVLENNVKLQNMTFNIIPEGMSSPKIYVGGNEFVMDSVSTKIMQTDSRKPTIIGGVKEGDPIGTHAQIKILNGSSDTAFKKIIAGNENDDSHIPVSISIDSEFVTVDEGISLGGDNGAQTTEKITLISNSKNTKLIDATNSIDNEVYLKDSKFYSLELRNVANLTLESKAELSLNNPNPIPGNLDVKSTGKLSINGNKVFQVGNLRGAGEIILGLNASLSVENNISDPVTVKINGTEDQLLSKVGTVYVSANGDINDGVNVLLSNPGERYSIVREDKKFKLENKVSSGNTYIKAEPILTFDKASIAKMEVISPPKKVKYIVGENFDISGTKVKLTDSNGISKVITHETFTKYGISVNKIDPLRSTDDKIILSLGDKSVIISVNVTAGSSNNSGGGSIVIGGNTVEKAVPKKDEDTKNKNQTNIKIKNIFDDITDKDWFYNDILYVNQKGYMTGTSHKQFNPLMLSSRAMVNQIIYNMENKPETSKRHSFVDIEQNTSWYEKSVNFTFDKNIIVGFSDNTFRGSSIITREQLAKILYNYAKYKGYDINIDADVSTFTDFEKTSEWAKESIRWAVRNKIIKGTDTNNLKPKDSVTRAELATILKNFDIAFHK